MFVATGWMMEGGRDITNVTPRYVRFSLGDPVPVGAVDPPPVTGPISPERKAVLLKKIETLEQQLKELKDEVQKP